MLSNYLPVLVLLIVGIVLSIWAGKLTITAAITGGVIGFLVFAGAGYTGIAMMTTFFMLGSTATSWKMGDKEISGIAEKNKGRRKASQVIANAGVAGLLGLLILIYPSRSTVLRLMMAASFASATADTLSSELGNIYGRRFYNILSFKKDSRGLDGVVSLEGTLFGIAGSTVIALLYALGFGWNIFILWTILAGTIGNIADSLLGATLERKHYLNNDVVNFLNTLIAALAALLLFAIAH